MTETLNAEPHKRSCCVCGREWDDNGLACYAEQAGVAFEAVLADFEVTGCEAMTVKHRRRRILSNLNPGNLRGPV